MSRQPTADPRSDTDDAENRPDTDDAENRPAPGLSRRRVLAATVTTVGLAGCTGDGGDGDSGGDDDTPTDEDDGDGGTTGTTETTTETEEPTTTTQDGGGSETTTTTQGGGETTSRDLGDPIGGVEESSVDGLAIVGLESKVAESFPYPRQGEWGVKIDVENTGGQSTELNEYTWEVVVYDEAGDVLKVMNRSEGNMIVSPAGGRTLEAGETTGVAIQPTDAIDPEEVGSYEVSLTCGTFADGVYC